MALTAVCMFSKNCLDLVQQTTRVRECTYIWQSANLSVESVGLSMISRKSKRLFSSRRPWSGIFGSRCQHKEYLRPRSNHERAISPRPPVVDRWQVRWNGFIPASVPISSRSLPRRTPVRLDGWCKFAQCEMLSSLWFCFRWR